jgi:tRNA A37 threonylcarbamoyladenosine synthetase subunit TsaC/SUA5/YrdC
VDLVIDAGTLTDVPSTLVNVRRPDAVVEREGAISGEAIAAALEGSAGLEGSAWPEGSA